MLMIRPLPAGIICASASGVRTKAPPRFTSIACHHSAGRACQAGPTGPLMPALLMRTSTGPSLSRSSATAAAVARWAVSSAETAAATPPARLISPTAAASSPGDRAMSATAAPASASRVLSSLPRPRLPPLTSATMPSSGRLPAPLPADATVAVAASVSMTRVTGADLARRGAVPLDEQSAKDLARRGPRDAVGELDLTHPLVAGHALGHPRHQLLCRYRGRQHDEGLGYLPGQRVALTDDGRVRHRGVGQQEGLDLGGRDLVALVLDQLLDPVGHVEPAVLAGRDDVAGVHPSVSVDRGRGRLRVTEVPAHRAGRTNQQLAGLT